jgi:Domain of unknown function (DUF4062)
MKVFISSVRGGLEEERDALPSLVQASGHEPRRFEDYTAMNVPSRQACLDGVEDADAYLILLGERYGDPLPDTGKAPTEEEFTVARRRGIPILVFRKRGVEPESEQREFIARVEEYATGKFRAAFSTTPELLAEAVAALRELEKTPPVLKWTPLVDVPDVSWMVEPEHQRGYISGLGAILELHVIPALRGARLKVGDLDNVARSLAALGRDMDHFTVGAALDIMNDGEIATVQIPGHAVGERGIRVSRNRTTVTWKQLERDGLGSIVDASDIQAKIADLLRIASETGLPSGDVCFAVSLGPVDFTQEGSIEDLGRRSSASIGMSGDKAARVFPEDSVPAGSLSHGADEVARELGARLIHSYRGTRG